MKRLHRHADADVVPIFGAAEQKQRQKNDGGSGDSSEKGDAGTKRAAKKGEELKEKMDDIIDQIDDVLEENAEEFVKNYVQRGGE